MEKLNLYGQVSKNGKLAPFGKERLEAFLNDNKGKRLFLQFTCIEPNTVDHHVWYFMKMIVPAFIEGNKQHGNGIDSQEAVEQIISVCPFFEKTIKERHTLFDFNRFIPNTEMQREELELSIEWLHYYCLENFNIAIGIHKQL